MSFVAAIVDMGMSIYQIQASESARKRAQRKEQMAEDRIAQLEASRQEVINPYAQAMEMLGNPYANLQVSTQAAKFQAEQTDVALASSLDTLRATGTAGAGATALAMAAAKSKQGISADIAKQEARNIQLMAQGQAAMEKQMATMSAAGAQFEFQAREAREMQQLNRQASLASSSSQQAAAYQGQAFAAVGNLGANLVGLAGEVDWQGNNTNTEYRLFNGKQVTYDQWLISNQGGSRSDYEKLPTS